MGYLNATLTNKLILFLKITKFDQFLDKNVTECRLFYLFIYFVLKSIVKYLHNRHHVDTFNLQ